MNYIKKKAFHNKKMSVDIFGRNSRSHTNSNDSGVSLSYITKNFQRKGDAEQQAKDEAYQCFVLQKKVEGMEKFIQETIIPQIQQPQPAPIQPKSLITIWAEACRSLDADQFEWSFGDSNKDSGNIGYTMLTPG